MSAEWPRISDDFDITDDEAASPIASRGADDVAGNPTGRRGSYTRTKKYDDMTAIDWTHEFAKQREHKEELKKEGRLKWLLDSSQVWVVLLITGLSIGILAAVIDVVAGWLSGLRFGRCKSGFYVSREFCCLPAVAGGKGSKGGSTGSGADICEKWVTWSETFGISNAFLDYVVSWLICIVLAVGFASLACWLTLRYAPYARMSGMPEVKTIVGGFVIKGFFGFNTMAIKAIGLCLVVGSGIWVGKEGPLVHLACCCASLAMRPFRSLNSNEAVKREILGAAAAAGISVAFGAPIGGVLFTLEQVAYYANDRIMWHSFVCAMIAAVTLQTLNPFRTGKLVLFQVVLDRNWHQFESVPFAIIGVFGGLFGSTIIKLNRWFAKWRRQNKFTSKRPLAEVALVALVTAIISFPDIYMRLQSTVLLSYLFEECSDTTLSNLCEVDHWFSTIVLLLLAASVGSVLTAYSFGISTPAGILMPSMLVGAIGGRSVGVFMQSLHHNFPNFFIFNSCPVDGVCVTPGVYALVGAASALTGVTRLTVSSVVIIFELTGALTYVLPIMVGVMVAKWVGDSFGKLSIYDSWVQLLQYPLINKLDDGSIPDVPVVEVMTSIHDMVYITAETSTVAEVRAMMEGSPHLAYPVVSSADDPILLGVVLRKELLPQLANCPGESQFSQSCAEYIETSPMTTTSDATLQHVHLLFESLGLRFLIITQNGQLQGMLTKKDLWRLLGSPEKRAELNDDLFRTRSRQASSSDGASMSMNESLLS